MPIEPHQGQTLPSSELGYQIKDEEFYEFSGFNEDGTPHLPGLSAEGQAIMKSKEAALREVFGGPRPSAQEPRYRTPGSDDPYIPQATHGFSRPIPDHEGLDHSPIDNDVFIDRLRSRISGQELK